MKVLRALSVVAVLCCLPVAFARPEAAPDSNVPKERGIYLAGDNEGFTALVQARITGMKTGGGLKAALSYGAAKMTMKYRIRDARAGVRTASSQPVFYLSGVEPRDLTLLKLEEKGKEREFVASGMRLINGSVDAPKGDAEFKAEKSGDAYKLTFSAALKPGEYGFAYMPGGGLSANLLFDFGVDSAPAGSR